MQTLHRAILMGSLALSAAVPAFAQSEAELKDFFEGKSVRVKIDMPATQQGIDVYPDARKAIDMNQYSSRLKSYGVAVHNGESVMITKIHVKDKLIEFQLGGGGYGTFGDDTSSSTYVPSTPKTQREKDLEQMVKDESDPARKKRLQRELDDLRSDRQREDARNQARTASANEAKKERIAMDRLHGGSRFNIRYQNGLPPGLDSGGVMRALSDYVDFASDGVPSLGGDLAAAPAPAPQSTGTDIHKGMTLAQVEAVLGRADKTSDKMDGSVKVTTATYARGDRVFTAQFVEGVLVKYSIASK
jgi:hypothetical protein